MAKQTLTMAAREDQVRDFFEGKINLYCPHCDSHVFPLEDFKGNKDTPLSPITIFSCPHCGENYMILDILPYSKGRAIGFGHGYEQGFVEQYQEGYDDGRFEDELFKKRINEQAMEMMKHYNGHFNLKNYQKNLASSDAKMVTFKRYSKP